MKEFVNTISEWSPEKGFERIPGEITWRLSDEISEKNSGGIFKLIIEEVLRKLPGTPSGKISEGTCLIFHKNP